MKFERASGVLAHPTSFPGPHGIGDLGAGAYQFVDWLVAAGQQYWQVMPLSPTGFGDSPYASPSAFAGNTLLISLEVLRDEALLDQSDLDQCPAFSDHQVQYGRVIQAKNWMFRRAFERFRAGGASSDLQAQYQAFCAEATDWLEDYALYMALQEANHWASWQEWEAPIRAREPGALEECRDRLAEAIDYHKFVQFLFRRQWRALKAYANERGVRVIGDIPIYVALDSADVWARQELFRLNEDGSPEVVTGVPPDLFTEHGQLWGNPAFDWNAMRRTGYQWWIDRIAALMEMVDVVRLDHFRGFAAGWLVPAGDATARGGRWERGPGTELFRALEAALGPVPFIAEDLGLITRDVGELREALGLPGMKVLQFAFDGDPNNQYLPHTYSRNCVVYTGTHDNQTTVGWFTDLPERERRQVQTYVGQDGSDIAWDFIRLALASVADLAILPLQDIMRLGDEARMNTPGQPLGNWSWRFLTHQLHPGMAAGLHELTHAYGRRPSPEKEISYDPFDYTAPDSLHPLHEQP